MLTGGKIEWGSGSITVSRGALALTVAVAALLAFAILR